MGVGDQGLGVRVRVRVRVRVSIDNPAIRWAMRHTIQYERLFWQQNR